MAMTLLPALWYGEKSAKVRDFQEALRVQVEPSIKVDGAYGPQTEQFVQKAYQQFSLPPKSKEVTEALYNAVMKIAPTPYLGPPVKDAVPTASFFKDPNTTSPAQPVVAAPPSVAVALPALPSLPPIKGLKASMGLETKIALGLGGVAVLWLMLKKK